jgi:hypothetical protein
LRAAVAELRDEDFAQPSGCAGSAAGRAAERIAGAAFPASWSDRAALLVGTGRQAPTGAERADLAPEFPVVVG